MNYLSNLPFHLKSSFPIQPSSLLGSGSGGSSSLYLGGSDGTSLNLVVLDVKYLRKIPSENVVHLVRIQHFCAYISLTNVEVFLPTV